MSIDSQSAYRPPEASLAMTEFPRDREREMRACEAYGARRALVGDVVAAAVGLLALITAVVSYLVFEQVQLDERHVHSPLLTGAAACLLPALAAWKAPPVITAAIERVRRGAWIRKMARKYEVSESTLWRIIFPE